MKKIFRVVMFMLLINIIAMGERSIDAKALGTMYSASTATDSAVYTGPLQIPTINIVTETGEDPTCDYVVAPEGYIGRSVTNNEYIGCNVEYYDSYNEKTVDEAAKIKIRGNTSAASRKKPFMIKFEKKKGFDFCTDKGTKKWLLLAAGNSLKYFVSNTASKLCGIEWQPQFQYVNMTMNGEPRGTYILAEAADTLVKDLNVDDTGLFIENDAYWWNEDVYFKTTYNLEEMAYTFKHPEDEALTETVVNETKDYMQGLYDTLQESNTNYLNIIDGNSFAAWFLAKDFLSNYDECGSNIFYYRKNSESKLQMGPTWDYDWDYEGDVYEWSKVHSMNNLAYAEYLFNRASFRKLYRNQLEKSGNIYEKLKVILEDYVQKYGDSLQESWNKDNEIWGKGLLNVEDNMKSYLDRYKLRMKWIDSQTADWSLYFTVYHKLVEEASGYNLDEYPNGGYVKALLAEDVYDVYYKQEDLDSLVNNLMYGLSILSDASVNPTASAVVVSPSAEPSSSASVEPSVSVEPSESTEPNPSVAPSESAEPTESTIPSENPSLEPTESASLSPSVAPSESASLSASVEPNPSVAPSASAEPNPSVAPSESTEPSLAPSESPSAEPSVSPSESATQAPDSQDEETLKPGYTFTKNKITYKVITVKNGDNGKKTGTLMVIKSSKKIKNAVIPAKLTVKGVDCKVTKIKAKAFKKRKKLKKIVIGKNVKSIGNKAFFACKRVKKIKIKSKKLTKKSIGKKVFGKIGSQIKIKVPKKKLKLYKKVLGARGLKKACYSCF
ncbi:MAG: CotH kinase family protein [Lachnospiraceae bacterium]|nr:CotH kinase family protein [Lachnospiraceae bacterium]